MPVHPPQKVATKVLMTMAFDEMARGKTAVAEGERRAKAAVEAAEARVDAVISEAEARVKAHIAGHDRRMRDHLARLSDTVRGPKLWDWESMPLATDGGSLSLPRETADGFREAVSVLAYYKSEQRGFVPGQETDDWLEAEQELLADFS